MNKKCEIICICCPRGCHLQVDPENVIKTDGQLYLRASYKDIFRVATFSENYFVRIYHYISKI